MYILKITIVLTCFFGFYSCSNSKNSGNSDDTNNDIVFVGNSPVLFSEIYLANTDYKDEFDENPAWVEFYNPSDTVVNLKGYSLTNNAQEILWTFENASILPNSYLVVFFSGHDKPFLNPPSDSIDLIQGAIGAWKWADNENDPAGKSTAKYNYSKSKGISGTLKTEDNLPALNWATSTVMLKFSGWNQSNVIDMANTNQILLRGYLGKNQNLEIRLPSTGVEDWVAWNYIIKGSGRENDLYVIELPQSGNFPDLKNIYGMRFGNVSNNYGTIDFSFSSIVAQKKGSNIHADFKLNKNEGKLFLMDSLMQVRDTVSYPAAVRDLSFAKDFDNNKWAFSKPPTPNAANSNELYTEQAQISTDILPESGYYEKKLSFTLPTDINSSIVLKCDTTGALPNEDSELKSGTAVKFTKTVVMRCAGFKSGAYQSETIMRTYIIGEPLPSLPVVSIAVEPKDMFDSASGLYATGLNASSNYPYFGANYWADTKLPIQIDFFENGAKHAWSYPAGIEIFGNYSRANSKKSVAIGFKEKYGHKNLKYPLLPEHPNLTKFKWFILRNNGGNYGKDYIRDMLMTSLTEGLNIDYQKGRAVIVYYNGKYFGIHNLRERSNGDYFETNYNINENLIDLVKGNNEISRGSNEDYQNIMQWLVGVSLNDENLKLLEKSIDINNYTNYMQSEIYFLNKDWLANNLKRWRVNSFNTKWRWFLYDTDFGFGGYDEIPNVKMLDFVTEANGPDYPNPPQSTLMLRKLLKNESYKAAFINRFSLLLATYFAPARVNKRINALMEPIAKEIPRDQERWNLNANSMNAELDVIKNFANTRPAQMQTELEQFFELENPIDFTISAKGNGKVLVNDLPVLNGSATFKAYSSIPIKIKAETNGTIFKGWSDGITEAERIITLENAVALEAEFINK